MSKTEENLKAAFAGESQARNRYTYFSGAAKKEGLVQIADIFDETANQEKEHAKRFFKFLEGGDVQITETFPAGRIGTTLENLRAAAAGEEHEWTEMYPTFAKEADEEGNMEAAVLFRQISKIEQHHQRDDVECCTTFFLHLVDPLHYHKHVYPNSEIQHL